MISPEVLADRSLACRLERAEGTANARFVEARARVAPELGAEWIEIAGVYAMYDGPRSPCTQTFGLGLFQMPTSGDMDRLEAFFRDRGAPAIHEVSPLAGIAVLGLLHDRGYRLVELSSVLYLALANRVAAAPARDGSIRVRTVEGADHDLWARTAEEGWREITGFSGPVGDLMRVSSQRRDTVSFLAELDGRPIAAGALAIHEGVGLLAGASTIPEWRKRGAQQALLASRLAYAADARCDLAMMVAEPGSASQRNAERHGFRIAYTRIKWELAAS